MSDIAYRARDAWRGVSRNAAPVPADLPCRTEILDAEGLATLCPADWDALCADALEDNPFFARQMVLAGITALGDGGGLKALVLRPRRGPGIAGLLPFRDQGLGPLRHGRPARNLYQVGGTPLVSARHAPEAVATLLGLMARGADLPPRWVFPHVAAQGPFMSLFAPAAAAIGWRTEIVTPYVRPVLTRKAGDLDAHVSAVIGKKRAKDIARNLRRLGDLGHVTFERADDPQTVAARIEAFLEIERAGWKGARGTAFLSRPDHAEFARKAFAGTRAAHGLTMVDSLLLDGEPIAVSINIGAGRTLFTPKCAFDERYRKYGPGMILEYKVIEAFFAEDRYEEMDAATTVDEHVIAGFWDSAKPMGTMVAGPSDSVTRGFCDAIARAARAKAWVKGVLRRG